MEEQNDLPVIREAVVMKDKVGTYDFLVWCQRIVHQLLGTLGMRVGYIKQHARSTLIKSDIR